MAFGLWPLASSLKPHVTPGADLLNLMASAVRGVFFSGPCWLSAIFLAIERIPNAGSNQDRFKKFIKAEDQLPNFFARYSMIDFILQVIDISY